MDIWLQEKYILLLSNRLEKFTRVSPRLFQCRCPFCGDSEKNPHKKRGYIYLKASNFKYHCHNCNKHINFEQLLKSLDGVLYYEMKKESLSSIETLNSFEEHIKNTNKNFSNILENIVKISDLPITHKAHKYLRTRKIPKFKFKDLYYCENFKQFVNPLFETPKFKSDKHAIERIIIPFYDVNGALFGFQGRAINPDEEIRYISIILDDSKPKAYNLNNVDFNKKYYVFEGPFDSMFVENSMAVCGSDMHSVLVNIGCRKDNAVIIFDNEPRNKQIVNSMVKFIELGWNVVIWPDSWEFKDINDAIIKGESASFIQNILDENTYNQMIAKLKIIQWRKDDC